MNQTDIKEVLELLREAISNKDWDKIYDAEEFLSEFLDDYNKIYDEN